MCSIRLKEATLKQGGRDPFEDHQFLEKSRQTLILIYFFQFDQIKALLCGILHLGGPKISYRVSRIIRAHMGVANKKV